MTRQRLGDNTVVVAVMQEYRISCEALTSGGPCSRDVTEARWAAYYLLERTGWSVALIAVRMGCAKSTVQNAIRELRGMIRSKSPAGMRVRALEVRLNGK
jgi:hypothetical protein